MFKKIFKKHEEYGGWDEIILGCLDLEGIYNMEGITSI